MIPIVSVIGKKNSGKTTLLEKLIPELKRRGHRVGVIKHDVHGFEMDHEGKDTYRQFHAGADMVLIQSPTKMAMVRRLTVLPSLQEIAWLYAGDLDLLLTEGYKSGDCPKIEVFRRSAHKKPLFEGEESWVAFVTDDPVDVPLPRFRFEEVERLAERIEETFLQVPKPVRERMR
ncbi:MAG: molybdopterin-guanine dinucleotide biosynthesis protein B [Planctomycetota bacterium]